MAKAPVPGKAKTRLSPPLTPHQAAALSAAFLRDVTENIRAAAAAVPVSGYVAYAPHGSEPLFRGHLAEGTSLLLADGSPEMPSGVQGFGKCLLHAIRSMLDQGHHAACVLNSDSPTLPTAMLIEAARALLARPDCIVLGAADDGGYYLLGMTAPHAHLFEDIAWSTASVAAATRERAGALGLRVVELMPWFDVDDAASLQRLIDGAPPSTSHEPFHAPATAACISRLALRRTRTLSAAQ